MPAFFLRSLPEHSGTLIIFNLSQFFLPIICVMKKIIFLLISISVALFSSAQKNNKTSETQDDSVLLSKTKYRLVGPFRGGRSGTVCGDYKDKNTFYFGSTGGGVWKTQDGGSNWKNISDKFFGGSIGSVAVAPSNPSIIYAGEGESTLRGNVSEGLSLIHI